MKETLQEERFNYISETNKEFIVAFDDVMTQLGYESGGTIGDGYCWGRHMIIYRKAGVKSQKVYARIYILNTRIVLRLFFSNIDTHRDYIENAVSHIKTVFIGEYGNCRRCHNEREGKCKFRKSYTLDGCLMEKCNGNTFEFYDPTIDRLDDYVALFTEFYPTSKIRRPDAW